FRDGSTVTTDDGRRASRNGLLGWLAAGRFGDPSFPQPLIKCKDVRGTYEEVNDAEFTVGCAKVESSPPRFAGGKWGIALGGGTDGPRWLVVYTPYVGRFDTHEAAQ